MVDGCAGGLARGGIAVISDLSIKMDDRYNCMSTVVWNLVYAVEQV